MSAIELKSAASAPSSSRRPVMVAAAIVTAIAAIAIWIVVRDDPAERGFASYYPAGAHREAASVMSSAAVPE